jgi:hypothetical protein
MRLDSTGLGIGTSSPGAKLDVRTSLSATTGVQNIADFYPITSGSTDGTYGGRITLYTKNLNNNYWPAAIAAINDAGGSNLSSLGLYTAAGGATLVERARIDSSGNFLVGTTTSPSGSKNLVVAGGGTVGAIKIQGASTDYQGLSLYYGASGANASSRAFQIAPNYISVGRLDFLVSSSSSTDPTSSLSFINGSTGAYTAVSDARAKKNIVDCQYGLSSVMSMRPVLYNMISENDGTTKHIGFIAQEIKAVINEAVTDTDNEEQWYGLDKSELVPVLVKALQELNAKFEAYVASHP